MTALTTLIAVLMVVLAPASIGAAIFLWQLHAESRRLDGRVPKPFLRLSLVMSLTGTFAAASATLLAIAAVFYLAGNNSAAAALWPVILVAFLMLDLIPVVNAAYLKRLDGPPPWVIRDGVAVPGTADRLR